MAESMKPDRKGVAGRLDRAGGAFFGLVGLWYLDSFLQATVERLNDVWDGQRLAPVFAAYRGYSIYPAAGAGPPVGYSYGPASVLAYLPAVAAPDPTAALLAAAALTLAYSLGPVLALLALGTRGGAARPAAVALGALLFAVLARNPALAYSTMSPVHDAVALGLGLAACLPLLGREAAGWRPLAGSAALAVAAALAKQNAAFLLPSLTLYCAAAFGVRAGLGFAAMAAGIGMAAGLALARAYGPANLFHYLFGVQGSMPMVTSRIPGLIRQVTAIAVMPTLLIGSILYLFSGPGATDRPAATLRARLARSPWALPLLVGLGNLPIAMLGAMKMGGDSNSLSYTLYYLTAAAALAVAVAASRGPGPAPEFGRRAARAVAAMACVPWLTSQVIAAPAPLAFRWDQVARRLRENPNQRAYVFAKAHPGSAYFPWNTLAVLMAEGRLYITEDAIRNVPPPGGGPHPLGTAGFFPESPEFVVYPPQFLSEWGKFATLGHFTQHRRFVRLPGLEDFLVFARGGDANSPLPGDPSGIGPVGAR